MTCNRLCVSVGVSLSVYMRWKICFGLTNDLTLRVFGLCVWHILSTFQSSWLSTVFVYVCVFIWNEGYALAWLMIWLYVCLVLPPSPCTPMSFCYLFRSDGWRALHDLWQVCVCLQWREYFWEDALPVYSTRGSLNQTHSDASCKHCPKQVV